MRRLILDHALLPGGWARNVGLDIEGGTIAAVQQTVEGSLASVGLSGVAADQDPRISGKP